jgi:hypothetical protein
VEDDRTPPELDTPVRKSDLDPATDDDQRRKSEQHGVEVAAAVGDQVARPTRGAVVALRAIAV